VIFAGDAVIKMAIEQGLKDMRENSWLLDDVLSQFAGEESLKNKYGQKEINAAKEWFLNNNIAIYLQHRMDKDEFPAITIGLGSSVELEEMKHLADLSADVETLMPNQIGKPIPYIVKPFVPQAYSFSTGIVEVPNSVTLAAVNVGMILLNPANGHGYEIKKILPGNQIRIDAGIDLDATKLGIVPQYQFYRVRREHSFFAESYTIGCHVHGDVAPLLWLHAIVSYTLLRYRESLLESRGFTQSKISSSDLVPNQDFSVAGGENVYSRYVTLSGQVENSWLKSPKRVIESTIIADVPDTDGDGWKTGIKIINGSSDNLYTDTDAGWTTFDPDSE
jgi:hypothetical protein